MKRKLNIICVIVMVVLVLGTCIYALRFDYRLIKQDGKHYFVFNDPLKYGVPTWPSDMSGSESSQAPIGLHYSSGKELVRAIKFGNLTNDEKKEIARFYREDKGRIAICDFDNFYETIPAKGWKITEVTWAGRQYNYTVQKEDWYGGIYFSHDELFDEKLEYYMEGQFTLARAQVIRREHLDDGQTEVIYHSYNSTPHYPERAEEYKSICFSLSDGDKTMDVIKKYSLPSEELVETKAFVTEGTQKYILSFGRGVNISDETLLQFEIKKVNVVSPWVGIVSVLGFAGLTIGIITCKKMRNTKRCE